MTTRSLKGATREVTEAEFEAASVPAPAADQVKSRTSLLGVLRENAAKAEGVNVAPVPAIKACPNCKQRPVFKESDDPEFPIYLVHDEQLCPPPFGMHVYHETQALAIGVWNKHVDDALTKRG
jgi:hypothetical protein